MEVVKKLFILKAKAFDQSGQRSYNNDVIHEGVLVNVNKINFLDLHQK